MNKQEYDFDFPMSVLNGRVSIALSKLGLNEFYASFKYLRDVLIHIFKEKDDSSNTIREGLKNVQAKYGITDKTLLNAMAKVFSMCPEHIFASSPLYGKIRLNFHHKTRLVKDYVLSEIKKSNMAV